MKISNILPTVQPKGSVAKFSVFSKLSYHSMINQIREQTMIDFKGAHFDAQIILLCIRWYVAYPLSYRQIEEMMQERSVSVDHSTLNRWVLKYFPELEKSFRSRKLPVGTTWQMDETYVKVKGKYLYRAVDKEGQTINFLLTARRNQQAAKCFLRKVISSHGIPERITIDKSGANRGAIGSYNAEQEAGIELWPSEVSQQHS
jgi:putative transposase